MKIEKPTYYQAEHLIEKELASILPVIKKITIYGLLVYVGLRFFRFFLGAFMVMTACVFFFGIMLSHTATTATSVTATQTADYRTYTKPTATPTPRPTPTPLPTPTNPPGPSPSVTPFPQANPAVNISTAKAVPVQRAILVRLKRDLTPQ